ncbi:ABC transporter ATP-binding protein [Spiroplasma sabaudiense Ar-1343]|uniref:ABC transporter ATP-binding protein n=1 Tax=Spiroplasma sabaudiense Ar-1343 TaxID=1276257 RepID=W6AKR3_9MOLU|nr:ABC transporter ATP-binding protein [Spiroplasma sabaudiense]AHI54309.1 ABC transporter ATP-binding protein [Spiroplasma sabaudiense Ar-1343]
MIELKSVFKVYKSHKGINNISFKINKQDVVAFVGDNGAGKTTTIKAIFKEIKLDLGQITFNNEVITKKHLQKMAFFPDSNNIPLDLKVEDYIYFVGLLNGVGKKEITKRGDKLLRSLNILDSKEQKLSQLSAGMKKKAILAATLVYQPEVIIFDEPTANLDIKAKTEFIEIIDKLHHQGITILITSHLIDELQKIANHLIIIDKGKIIYDAAFDKNKESILEIHNRLVKPAQNNIEDILGVYDD